MSLADELLNTPQSELPGVEAAPSTLGLEILTELEVSAIRRRIVEADGSMEAAGIDLPTMRNVIYTCRMKANPLQDEGQGEAKPKPSRAKADKPPSTKTAKLSGEDVNNFLG